MENFVDSKLNWTDIRNNIIKRNNKKLGTGINNINILYEYKVGNIFNSLI